MRHSSSKPAPAAGAGLRIGELALTVLVGTVLALLIESTAAFDRVTIPASVGWLRWLIALLVVAGMQSQPAWLTPRLPPCSSPQLSAWLPPCFSALPGVLIGLVLALPPLANYHRHRLHEAAAGRQLVGARVLSLPERDGGVVRFVAELEPARPDAAAGQPVWPLRARLTWKRAPTVAVGERWQLLVELNPLLDARNPGQGWFDRQSLRAGVHASGAVLESRLNQMSVPAPLSVDRLRAWLSAQIHTRIAERDSAALLVALAVGDTQYVSREQWRVFNAVGITHLIAISGLHVTLFSLLTAALARRLWPLLPWLWRRVRREHCAALTGVIAAWGYALLSGFSVPAQRTLIMLATWHGLRALARPAAVAPALAVAMLCVLCLDPLAPLGAGFWLSFVAVAVLMHALPDAGTAITSSSAGNAAGLLRRGFQATLELCRTQWHVALGLLPVTLAVFGSASIAGLYVNLLAIPVFSFALVPLILLSLPLLGLMPAFADTMLQLAAWIAAAIMPWLTRAADWDFALWRLHAPVWAVLLAVPAVWLLMLPARWFIRGTACCALLPVFWPVQAMLADGEFTATLLDTGRGQALLVRTAHHALLYDNGEHWGSEGAVTREVVLPALRAAGLRQVDRVLMPRLDNDRGVGLALLAAEFSVRRWQAGGATSDLPPEFAPCPAGENWQWDSVRFESVLEGECALRITASPGATLLLAAELDRAAQQRLVDAGAARCDVLILPRHAAATAYLAAYRDASGARWVLVAQSLRGAGAATAQRVLEAWRSGGAQLWLTGADGAVTVRGSARGVQLSAAGD